MCRLTAYVGPPASVATLVYGGSHSLERQSWAPKELLTGSVNADGWGVVWYSQGEPRRLADTRPVWQEQDLRDVLQVHEATCALASLRNASPGLPVDRSGLLPMIRGRWSFILNGFVPGFRTRHMRPLRSELPDHLYATLEGVSDSETLFLLALHVMEQGATPAEALRAVARRVYARVERETCHLTMALSDGTQVTALRSANVVPANSLYLLEGGTTLAPGGSVLASERLDDDPGWRLVPGEATVVLGEEGAEVFTPPSGEAAGTA